MINSVRKTSGIKFNATTPDGVHKTKYFSFKKYKESDVARMGDDWMSAVRSGLPEPKWKFVLKKEGTGDDGSSSESDNEAVEDTIELKPFELDIPDRKFGCSVLCLGATRSGKSTCIDHLLKTYFPKDYISILHTNSPQSDIYDDMKKKAVIAPTYFPQLIEESYQINKNTKNKYEFLHIIDDVVDKKNDKTLLKLLTIMRNTRLTCIISGQELSIFNAIARSNINFVLLFRLNSDMAIEKAIKSYLQSWFPAHMKIRDMIKKYKELTADHHFFVIDNLNDKIFLSKIDI